MRPLSPLAQEAPGTPTAPALAVPSALAPLGVFASPRVANPRKGRLRFPLPTRPKYDNTSSPFPVPRCAFPASGSGLTSTTGLLFLNIPLDNCEKSVYVLPILQLMQLHLELLDLHLAAVVDDRDILDERLGSGVSRESYLVVPSLAD